MTFKNTLICPLIFSLLTITFNVFANSASHTEKRKVILDDDGFGIAQWMLVLAPQVEVLGVSQVSGNRWQGWNVRWALRALELAKRSDIPVYPGAVFPLVNTEKSTELWEQRYGKLVWKGAWQKAWVEDTEQSSPLYHPWDQVPDLAEGNPKTQAANEHAANFMLRMVRQFPGEVSIIATGPLTNIALAQSLDPSFAHLAKEFIYMGGSLHPQQQLQNAPAEQFAREFVHSPRREFNWRWDPEAARIAMRAPWKKITMIPVDPSTATQLSPKLLKAMSRAKNSLSAVIAKREPNFPLWDEIASAVWLQPNIIQQASEWYIDAVIEFGPNYGDTLSWAPGYQPGQGEQLQTVVSKINVKAMEKLMVKLMNRKMNE